MENNLYSYHSCLAYSASLATTKKLSVNFQKDIIALCADSAEIFWRDFKLLQIKQSDYNLICSNIYKYVVDSEPIAYLRGNCFFYNMHLQIENGVFIPQPDTEILVEKAISLIEGNWGKNSKLEILEIGSGSGNISLSIAKRNILWQITGVDINQKALSIASLNANNMAINNVEFIFSNLFVNVKKIFDVIISNPPYVSENDYSKLTDYVKKQPFNALVAADNGLYFYQQIIDKVKDFLKEKFLVIFEIGYNQENEIIKMLLSSFHEVNIKTFKDLNQKSRVLAFYN